ncbi:MAG TPA: hypothetical protein VFL81_02635, partial [Candidatus Saccharimonadales bacterium]|nr:hypothetical protein [Candidatus Saccharimonadales bacterium]
HPQSAPPCSKLYNQSCPGFFKNNNFSSISITQRPDGAVQVGDPSLNQRYTCVIVTSDVAGIVNTLIPHSGKDSDFFPLKAAGDFNQIRIAWGRRDKGQASAVPPQADVADQNLRDNRISANGTRWQDDWPAMLAVTNLQYPASGFTVGQARSYHFFLVPSQSGGNPGGISADSAATPSRQLVNCDASAPYGLNGGYVCQATLTLADASLANWERNLALTAYYNTTDFEVSLHNSSTNQTIKFDGVRPTIDSTGAVSDVYRRVMAQVDLSENNLGGINAALDLGGGVCKNFMVTADSSQFQEHCETPDPGSF